MIAMEEMVVEAKSRLETLEALKHASYELRTNPTSKTALSNSCSIETLLNSISLPPPNLTHLSESIGQLKTLFETQRPSVRLRSFLTRRLSAAEVSRLAATIESEIQSLIDRETIDLLCKTVDGSITEEHKLNALILFEKRISQGFDPKLQDLVLRSRVFSYVESILCNLNCGSRIREQSALVIASLIRFNKDVFVFEILMGSTVWALVSMGTVSSLTVLCVLIKYTKSPLVDEIESNGEIPEIIRFLYSEELGIQLVGMDCVLEIGYYGRKEAIEAMIREGLIEKLVELQRSELGGDLIDLGEKREKWRSKEAAFLESHPFASCVARFGVMLEVGEGLREREKRYFKHEVVVRVRNACASAAEASTIVAEVLWGSSP